MLHLIGMHLPTHMPREKLASFHDLLTFFLTKQVPWFTFLDNFYETDLDSQDKQIKQTKVNYNYKTIFRISITETESNA